MRSRKTQRRVGAMVVALAFAACTRTQTTNVVAVSGAANTARGKALLSTYGCGACHTIPGVDNADALIGPPLTRMSERSYIAGVLPNSADQLSRWIRDPQSVKPGDVMPDLTVTDRDAADMVAYLYAQR